MIRKIIFILGFLAALLAIAARSDGQVAVVPLNNPHVQLLDLNGVPISGGKLYTYQAGTNTPLATYKDSAGTIVNTNPIVLDSSGGATVFLKTQAYKIVLQNSLGVTQWTVDNLTTLAVLGKPFLYDTLANRPSTCTASVTFFVQTDSPYYFYQCNSSGNGWVIANAAAVSASILAANNAFTGNNTHSGSETFTGTVTSNNLNGWLFVNGTNYATVAAALSALGSNPGTIYITPGTYNTSATITLGQGQHLVATAPCNLRESATTNCGATITWTGATSTPVINVHNASGASVEGITVDCANISGCIAYLYDSNNSPASTNSRFIGINAKGFHFGFVAGTGSTTPDVNGYQADTFRLEQFQFYGNCADLTSEGIIINSSNAGQHSVIDRGNIQCVNVAAEGVKSNGYIEFRRFNAGSPVGVNPTFLKVDADFGPYLAEVTETEGGWSFPVHDSSALGTANNSTWRLNQWNSTAGQVLVDGNSTILSENNQATATTWAVGGTAKIISIDEAVWNPTAAVTTFSTDGVTFGPQVKTFNYIAATASGSVPAGTVAGDMVSVNDATNGTVRLGSDGLGVLNRDSAGNLNSSKGYRVGAGGVNWIETTAPTAGAGQIPCYADSTSHTLKCDYNNTSFLNMAQIITATLTTTAATTDNVTVTGMTASGHCYLTPTNSGAAGGIASVFISNKTTNQITVTHTATSGWTFDVVCSPQ